MSDRKNDKKQDFNPVEEALEFYKTARAFRDANRVGYVQTPVGETLVIGGEEFECDVKARFYKAHDRMLTD